VSCEAIYESVRFTSAIFLIMAAATVVGWILKWERSPTVRRHHRGMDFSNALQLRSPERDHLITACSWRRGGTDAAHPIFAPLATRAGIDPFHFGIVMTLNVTIALITPPVGACNYIVAAVGKVPLGDLFKAIWPFIAVAMTVLLVIISFPALTVTVPRLLGL
jgi:TRAP-type C4-dicarboxylate transport system permease large subunit